MSLTFTAANATEALILEHAPAYARQLTRLAEAAPDGQVLRVAEACVFCPYPSNREWSALKDDSDAWARAVEIDRALRREDSACNRRMRDPMFLHRLCQPLEEIDFNALRAETLHPMTVGECHGMCGV